MKSLKRVFSDDVWRWWDDDDDDDDDEDDDEMRWCNDDDDRWWWWWDANDVVSRGCIFWSKCFWKLNYIKCSPTR